MAMTDTFPNSDTQTVNEGQVYYHISEGCSILKSFMDGGAVDTIIGAFFSGKLTPAIEGEVVKLPDGYEISAFGDAVPDLDRCLLIHHKTASDDYIDFVRPSELIDWIILRFYITVS